MNLLFSTIQGDIAGSTYSIFFLAKGLAERGHNVHCACRNESLLYKLFEDTQVKCIPLTSTKRINLPLAKELARYCNENEIQIVNAQSSSDRYAAILAGLFYGMKAKFITTRRQKPLTDAGFLLNRLLSSRIDWLVSVSQSIKEDLIQKGFPARKIKVIHNGTPGEKYQLVNIDEKKKSIIKDLELDENYPIIGSISRLKEQQQIIDSIQFLKHEVQLVFIGISKEDLNIDGVDSNPRLKRIKFLPHVDNKEVLYYYTIFNIFVQASVMEGISQAILEAMAMGVPVIATNASGNPEIVKNDNNGFLFEDGDINTLAEKINLLLEDHELSNRFIENGRKTALETFSIENTISKYELFFEEIISD